MDLYVLSYIGGDDVVHGPDMAARLELDSLTRLNLEWGNSFALGQTCFWKWSLRRRVNNPCDAIQAENLFFSIHNGESAVSLNAVGICQEEGSDAGFGQICEEDIPP